MAIVYRKTLLLRVGLYHVHKKSLIDMCLGLLLAAGIEAPYLAIGPQLSKAQKPPQSLLVIATFILA